MEGPDSRDREILTILVLHLVVGAIIVTLVSVDEGVAGVLLMAK